LHKAIDLLTVESIKRKKNSHGPFPARAATLSDALSDAHLLLAPAEACLRHALEVGTPQLFWKGDKGLVQRYILFVKNI